MVSKKPRGRGRPRSNTQTPLAKWIDGSGRTREQVAKALGVTKASLDRYCRGERTPMLGAALAIEKVTGGAIPARYWLSRGVR
jgi:transcriptional regulator with XRE-family HTH domain